MTKAELRKHGEKLADGNHVSVRSHHEADLYTDGYSAALELLFPLVDALDAIILDNYSHSYSFVVAKDALAELEKKVGGL
jgi:hypothetical protein